MCSDFHLKYLICQLLTVSLLKQQRGLDSGFRRNDDSEISVVGRHPGESRGPGVHQGYATMLL
jgi:hypothetical protein